jgi:predicted enzyme related to lactoylglutathione lyase
MSEKPMPRPARAGVFFYAKNLLAVSNFYEKVLGAQVLHEDNDHRVLQSLDAQLIIHAIPAQYSNSVVIEVPPVPRQEQAIKPFFTVENLDSAEKVAEQCGGKVWGPIWAGPGMKVRNVCDPEGNIVHLRDGTA